MCSSRAGAGGRTLRSPNCRKICEHGASYPNRLRDATARSARVQAPGTGRVVAIAPCMQLAGRTPRSEEVMKTDYQLKTEVTRELACDVRIDETAIGVTVHHGVVALHGIVGDWAEKHAAEAAAHRVAGVLDVANEIEIKPSWNAARADADIAEAVRDA